jgi:hypothetical protein
VLSSPLKEQEKCQGMHFSPPTGRDLMSDEYRIQELLERDVYVGETRVGVITGERFHPRDELVRSMRIKVEDDVAEEYMRKPAEFAPLSKELVHSIRTDGGVKLSCSADGETRSGLTKSCTHPTNCSIELFSTTTAWILGM